MTTKTIQYPAIDIEKLREMVQEEYTAENEEAATLVRLGFAYKHHVLRVALYARALAHKYHANPDICEAAALLHDIADARMLRESKHHEAESESVAVGSLIICGAKITEACRVYDTVIKPHSCRDGLVPMNLEGKILATADAMAHILDGFYAHFYENLHDYGFNIELFAKWAVSKIERDVSRKIFFPEERRLVQGIASEMAVEFQRLLQE